MPMQRLRRGENSPRVKALQSQLNEFFGQSRLNEDGDFGRRTEEAVKAAQRMVGQHVTGIADEALFVELLDLDVQLMSERPMCLDPEVSWMRVARSQMGMTEVAGNRHNARIVEYHTATTLPRRVHTDETAWCSSFVNWVFEWVGIRGTRSALAASWIHWGRSTLPREGAVVVI